MRGFILACVLLAGCDDPPKSVTPADLTPIVDGGAPEDLAEEGDAGAQVEPGVDLGKTPLQIMDVGVICTSCDGG